VRIQANPTALASYGLSLEDLRIALGQANVDQAKVLLTPSPGLHHRSKRSARFQQQLPPAYHCYRNGAPVRLTDVATVVDGVENAKQAAWPI